VTPFKVVQNKLRWLIKQSRIWDGWVENPQAWINQHIGTVHIVQGREAEAIIFVLGAPDIKQNGARNWAGDRPNLVNVAITRAKEVFYIIGNRDLWKSCGVFHELHLKL